MRKLDDWRGVSGSFVDKSPLFSDLWVFSLEFPVWGLRFLGLVLFVTSALGEVYRRVCFNHIGNISYVFYPVSMTCFWLLVFISSGMCAKISVLRASINFSLTKYRKLAMPISRTGAGN